MVLVTASPSRKLSSRFVEQIRIRNIDRPASAFLRDVDPRVFMDEVDVQGPQVGVEPGVLDRHQVGRVARFIVVRVPEPGRCHERRARLPVGALTVGDVPLVVELLCRPGCSSRACSR